MKKTIKYLLVSLAAMATLSYAQDSFELYDNAFLDRHRIYAVGDMGDAVDPFSGSLKLVQTDLTIPGEGGLDLQVTRLYSSRQNYHDQLISGKIGLDWRLHYGRVVWAAGGSCTNSTILYFESQDGELSEFAYNSSEGAFLSKSRWKITCSGSGYVVYSPDGRQYLADFSNDNKHYYVTKIADTNGNWIKIEGQIDGVDFRDFSIKKVSSSDGRRLDFDYSNVGTGNQRLRRIVDVIGNRTWNFYYTSLPGVTSKAYLSKVTRPDGLSWEYDYFGSHVQYGKYTLKSMSNPYGAEVRFAYGGKAFRNGIPKNNTVVTERVLSGRDLSTSTRTYDYAFSSSADTTTISESPSDKKQVYKHYGYSAISNGKAWKGGLPFEIKTYRNGRLLETVTLAYDKVKISNRQFTVRYLNSPPVRDNETYAPVLTERKIVRGSNVYKSTYRYSSSNVLLNPTSMTESGPNSSRSTQYTYSPDKSRWLINLIREEAINGIGRIERTFDSKGNMLSESRYGASHYYTYDNNGNMASYRDPNGNRYNYSSYRYDIARQITRPDNTRIRKTVNDYGLIASVTDANGQVTRYQYTPLNQLKKLTPLVGNAVVLDYDDDKVTTRRGSVTLTERIDGLGQVTSAEQSGSGVTTLRRTFKYDTLGRLTFASYVNSNKGVTKLYDGIDRVFTRCDAAGCVHYDYLSNNRTKVTDTNNHITTIKYQSFADPSHKAVLAYHVGTTELKVTRNALGQIILISSLGVSKSYGYDRRYYLNSITEPESGTVSLTNDNNGNVIRKNHAGRSTTFSYDRLNRLTGVMYPGGDGKVTYRYDYNGNLTELKRTYDNGGINSTYTMSYDGGNRLTAEHKRIGIHGYDLDYRYDRNDNLTSMQYPTRTIVSYQPDAFGRPTRIGDFANSLQYHPGGQLKQLRYGNGKYLQQELDDAKRINKITVSGVLNHRMTYDGMNNLTALADDVLHQSQSMRYDSLNRLTEDRISGSDYVLYEYDGLNNIVKKRTYAASHTYSYSNNRLSRISGTSNRTFSYDDRGNVSNDGINSYVYGYDGNLSTLNGSTRYSYDGNNQRIAKTHNGKTTYYVYDKDGQLIGEYDSSGIELKTYYRYGGDVIAQKRLQTASPSNWLFADSFEANSTPIGGGSTSVVTEYLHNDFLGTPVAATDSGGRVLWRSPRRAYGTVANRASKSDYPVGYTGYYEDSESDLSYAGARYYANNVGRFYSPDPVTFRADNLFSFNRYAYGNNNPYKYTDTDGRQSTDAKNNRRDLEAQLGIKSSASKLEELGGASKIAKDALKEMAQDFAVEAAMMAIPVSKLKGLLNIDKVIIETKVAKQMSKRGWTKEGIADVINNHKRTVATKDTRWRVNTKTKRNSPATAYIDENDNYVVVNDTDGSIVQISNKNDPNWKIPDEWKEK